MPTRADVKNKSIRKASAAAIAGVLYLFISRTAGTLRPDIFMNLTATRLNTLISFIASAAVLYFYYVFYTEFAKGEDEAVKRASFIMLISSLLVSILFFKGVLTVFDINSFRLPVPELAVILLSSLISLYFFVTIYKKTPRGKLGLLRQAAYIAAFGALLSVLIRSMIIFNYFTGKRIVWQAGYIRESPFIFLPIFFFTFFSGAYFFFIFYRELKAD